ncbi:CDP-alcohol phosphatidyltransferase family protein [Muribaculaceae bacterium Isolate-013 (NCI)]|jgi:CDP-diacylglycerol--glycerol-3-phosphate 3-phosphatidyltransferase|nr:CDP-alcohol phosphatidyltransferase family protein [Muribaculaceae bacterium Isolate-013 (NCI)]
MNPSADKNLYNKERDGLQQGIYRIINPFVRLLIRMGVTPNMVTTIGLLGNLAAAAILSWAGIMAQADGSPHYAMVTLAGAVIIVFSTFDMLDGQVARLGGMVSRFGALYDSVLDRYCELFTLGGIAFYMMMVGYPIGALVTFLALVGSIMVSYVRARAEGVGLECKVGFMQRPERVVVTAIGCLACGITGMCVPNSQIAIYILVIAMAVIAVFANITAFARVDVCRKGLKENK